MDKLSTLDWANGCAVGDVSTHRTKYVKMSHHLHPVGLALDKTDDLPQFELTQSRNSCFHTCLS